MRKAILFLAMSLDGFIADQKGGVGWLSGQASGGEDPGVYAEFVKDIDTVLMGWNTYRQIITELSPEKWPYEDLMAYVFTHRPEAGPSQNIRFVHEKPGSLLQRLKKEREKDIWICGGANLAQQLMEEDGVDQYYLSVIPTLLGSGVRLFGNQEKETKLKLLKTQSYNGITDLVYERR